MKSKTKKAKKSKPKPIKSTEQYRKKLEAMRDDLLRIVQKKKEELVSEDTAGDEGDVAVRSLERDLVFELTGNERRMLDEVEAALRRIEKKAYGLCEGCSENILIKRLQFLPHVRYCINCQARFESV